MITRDSLSKTAEAGIVARWTGLTHGITPTSLKEELMYGGGMAMMILWIVLLAVLSYWVVRTTHTAHNANVSPGEKPLDILRKRYARGEISREEFTAQKRDLQ